MNVVDQGRRPNRLESLSIEFDPKKDKINSSKHGCSLALTSELFDDVYFFESYDDNPSHGEERWIATGLIAECVFVCVYTMRGKARRIISLRKVIKPETGAYLKNR